MYAWAVGRVPPLSFPRTPTFCRRVWTGDSEHSEGYYNRQWNYVVNGRGDYNGDPLAESACDNAYGN